MRGRSWWMAAGAVLLLLGCVLATLVFVEDIRHEPCAEETLFCGFDNAARSAADEMISFLYQLSGGLVMAGLAALTLGAWLASREASSLPEHTEST